MDWLANLFTKYPEMGVYLAVGIGYVIGNFKLRGVGAGVVTGSLLAGILLGNCSISCVSDQAKSMLFLLVPLRYRVLPIGPSFFGISREMDGDEFFLMFVRSLALARLIPSHIS